MSGERVTVWFAYLPTGKSHPTTIAIGGVKTDRRIVLDQPLPSEYGCTQRISGQFLAQVAYTERDAVVKYHKRLAAITTRAREAYEEAERQSSNARWLLDKIDQRDREGERIARDGIT